MSSYYLFLKILSVVIAVASQILLKFSANIQYESKVKEYLNIFVVLGYTLFIVSSLLSIASLKGISISLSAIIETLSYILIPITSYFVLRERINRTQLFGMLIIIMGIVIFNV